MPGASTISAALTLRAAVGSKPLFMRKFDPASAPDVADAIGAGRYAEEILRL